MMIALVKKVMIEYREDMKRSSLIQLSGLIIAGFPLLVNPVGAAEPTPKEIVAFCGKKPSQNCLDFASLLQWLIRTGKIRTDYHDKRESELELPSGAFAKARGVPGETTPKNPDRMCSLLYNKDPQKANAKPVCVVLHATTGRTQETFIRLKLDGTADMAVDSEGKLDDKGETIESSARYKKLSLHKAEVKALIDREVEFWVKHARASAASVAKPVDAPAKSILEQTK
jgi:hypothetical protein